MSVNRCVMCNDVIPEGRQVCPNCETNTNHMNSNMQEAVEFFEKQLRKSNFDLLHAGGFEQVGNIEKKIRFYKTAIDSIKLRIAAENN